MKPNAAILRIGIELSKQGIEMVLGDSLPGYPGTHCYQIEVTPKMEAHQLEDVIDGIANITPGCEYTVLGGRDGDILTGEHTLEIHILDYGRSTTDKES